MAKYKITAPDGTAYEVTAPDDATEEQVLAYAQQQFQAQAPQAPKAPARSETDPSLWAGGVVPSIDPTEGMSALERFGAAYGGVMPRLAAGGKQLATDLATLVTPYYVRGGLAPEQARQRERATEQAALDAPLLNTPAGFWGNLAGNVAPMFASPGSAAFGASRAAPYAGAAVEGAAFGALQPVAEGESRATNTAVGGGLGVLGQGVASGTRAAASGAVSRLDDASRALADKASQIGVRLGLGEVSQNPALRTMVNQMERLPFSGGRARAEANQQAVNEAVGRTFGAKGDKLTPDAFLAAKREISQTFNDLTARNSLAPTPELVGQLQRIVSEAQRLGTSDSGRMVAGQVSELVSKTGPDGLIPGRAYQAFDSQLGTKLKSGGDPAFYLGQVREVVRQAMDESIAPADRAAWAAARQKWAAMKTVEPLVAKSADGDISAAALMQRVTSDGAGKVRMAEGRGGDLGDIARIGQRFLKASPNSGTADRALVNLGVLGALGGASYGGAISPETASYTALALFGNRGLGKLLSSKGLVRGDSKALKGLARIMQPAPKLLPAAAPAVAPVMDIGTVSGYDRNDPRYRGD